MRTAIANNPDANLENESSQSRYDLTCFRQSAPSPECGLTQSTIPRLPPVLFDDFPLGQKDQLVMPPQVYTPSSRRCSSSSSSITSSPAFTHSELSSLSSHPSTSTMCSSPSTPSKCSTPRVPRIPARFERQLDPRKETTSIPETPSPTSKTKLSNPIYELCSESSGIAIDKSQLLMPTQPQPSFKGKQPRRHRYSTVPPQYQILEISKTYEDTGGHSGKARSGLPSNDSFYEGLRKGQPVVFSRSFDSDENLLSGVHAQVEGTEKGFNRTNVVTKRKSRTLVKQRQP
ncbi:hypothetical protein MMC14_009523 [Varicellaria rhodocarpa]|nr:hypothetical protein [Varicellaria rhodocarpa]